MELRRYLEQLQNEGELATVDEPIAYADIPARVMAEEEADNRALLFTNVADYEGKVAFNTFGTQQRINHALGADDTGSFFRGIDAAVAAPKPLKLVPRDTAGYQVIPEPDLLEHVPAILSSRHDSTPYITSGLVVARDPDSGRHHVCYVRMSVQESNRVLFNPRTFRIRDIAEKTVGAGKPMDIAILIGAPTNAALPGGMSLPDEVDELEVIQALGGDEQTFLDLDLPVPTGTEMILFGQVLPDEERPEGPFGELTGRYSTRHNPVCVIRELWRRDDLVYHNILGGKSREHVLLVALKARHALEQLLARCPQVLDYRLPRFGAGQLCLLTVADGTPKQPLVDELNNITLIKLFVLINEDVPAENSDDVLWALTQRTRQRGDLYFNEADPARGLAEMIVLDATSDDLSDWNNIRIETMDK
jgi:UbiD family decarboxylase